MKLSDVQGGDPPSDGDQPKTLKLSDVQSRAGSDKKADQPTGQKDYTLKPTSAMWEEIRKGASAIGEGLKFTPEQIKARREEYEKKGTIGKFFDPLVPSGDDLSRMGKIAGGVGEIVASPATGLARGLGGDALRGDDTNPVRSFAANTYEDVAGLVGGGTEAKAIRAAGEAGSKFVGDVASKAFGTTAKRGAEALRSGAVQDAGDVAAQRQAEAATYQKRLDSVDAAQKQLAGRGDTAEARAQAKALAHPAFAEEQERVLGGIRERVRTAEQEYVSAGHSVEEAKKLAALDEQKVSDAEKAVGTMEREFLARPQATAEQFGQSIRQTTKALNDKYSAIREEQSGYKKAIESAGDVERVHTGDIIKGIDAQMKGIRNPSLEATLTHVKELLKTDDRTALTLRSSDSLKKYLDSIIQSKTIPTNRGPLAVDREALHYLAGVKKQLMKESTESWQPYREALGKWRTLSRPLDVVERKGALRKVLDTDPVSSDYANTEAQVVGQVLSQAKAGNPVFTRLLSESPELREPARLYFTKDLFGGESVPSEARLTSWLKSNEGALRQLHLYDEFRDIRTAKKTAARAVEDAKSARATSLDDMKAVENEQKAAGAEMQKHASLRDKEAKRIELAKRSSETPQDLRKMSDTRAGEAEKRLGREQSSLEDQRAQARKMSEAYQQFETDLQVARPKEVPAQARAFATRQLQNGVITHKQYQDFVRDIQRVEDAYGESAKAKVALLKIATGIIGSGLAYEGVKHSGLLP